MMDSYAYLHLAAASESPSEFQFKATVPINWKQFSSSAYPYFLSLAVLTTALALPQPAIAQVLRVGDRGSQVSFIQQRLQSLGYFNANVTGYYGPITRNAVIRFQQANGLSADGVAGPNTLAALGVGGNPNPPDPPLSRGVIGLGRGDQGPGVRDLQNRLRALGYFSAESTGFFGSITRNAVISFQRAYGIRATGLVSEETLVFLNNRVAVLPENPILPLPSPILQQGDTGAAVGVVQQQLTQLGFYDGAITNYFDARTEQAVINFQRAYGIQTTGQVGATTEGYLLSATGGVAPSFPTVPVANPPLPLRLGDRGASVSFVQQQLRRLGYYTGPVNGIFDLPTRRSVLAFQQDYGISRTGVVGATTQSYLVSAVGEPVLPSQLPSFVFAPQGRPIGGIAPAVQPVNPASAQGQPLNPVVPTPTPQGRPTTAPVTPVVTPINPASAQGRPLNPVIPAPTSQGRPLVSPLRPIQPITTYRSFVSVGDTGFEVRRIQQRLRALNYYRGPVNGFFDRTTQDAVVRFQRANGISQTGVVGPTTRIYMFNSANSSDSTPTADASSSESTTTASVSPQTTQRTYTFNSVKSSDLTSTVETSDSEPITPVKASTPVTPVSQPTNPVLIQTTLITPDASSLSSANIKELQQRLQVQGLYEGLINGVYDSQTETAVNKAYELYGTSANDVLFGGLQPQEN